MIFGTVRLLRRRYDTNVCTQVSYIFIKIYIKRKIKTTNFAADKNNK